MNFPRAFELFAGRLVRRPAAVVTSMLVALVTLLLTPIGFAAEAAKQGAAPAQSGEASLVLPDLSTAKFGFLGGAMGDTIAGRTLLMSGLVVCVLGLVFGTWFLIKALSGLGLF